MNTDLFPRPAPGPLEAPFWAACQRGELRIQRCSSCRAWQHPPRPRCSTCLATELAWEAVSGAGTVWSYTICHPPVLPAFDDRVPYNAVVIRLDEGPFLVSNLLCANDDIRVGLPVMVEMAVIDAELTIPQFRPAI